MFISCWIGVVLNPVHANETSSDGFVPSVAIDTNRDYLNGNESFGNVVDNPEAVEPMDELKHFVV